MGFILLHYPAYACPLIVPDNKCTCRDKKEYEEKETSTAM